MTGENNNTKPAPKVRSATIKLEGKAKDDFETVKEHCNHTLPGIIPDNADVIRYALHVAAMTARESEE